MLTNFYKDKLDESDAHIIEESQKQAEELIKSVIPQPECISKVTSKVRRI